MKILRVALNPLANHLFDYLPPDGQPIEQFMPGQRLRVPFGKKNIRIGLIISLSNTTKVAKHKLKKALALLDEQPLITQEQFQLIKWASEYYHHPIGDVAFTSIPAALRKGKPTKTKDENIWQLTELGKQLEPAELCQAKKQLAIFNFIKQYPNGVLQKTIHKKFQNSWTPLNALRAKKIISMEQNYVTAAGKIDPINTFKPNTEQQHAINTIIASSNTYHTFLLNGITGSGKTEVYLQAIQQIIDSGKQALIMTPEIGLTPQLIKLFNNRFRTEITVLHSHLSESARLSGWLRARNGNASIVLGTRSAIWTPMPKLGIIIVDEEHDLSYKQQNGLRYSARDLALVRGQKRKIPVILGSATPSMESVKNTRDGRYQELQLLNRTHNAQLPNIHIHDIRNEKMHGAISQCLLKNIKQRIDNKQQALLFLNRRGYAPIIMCHNCDFIFRCPDCDAYMTLHKHKNRLSCHHCEHNTYLPETCPNCSMPHLIEIGHGTERLAETLTTLLPKARILRIDRDTTRSKDSMQKMINDVHAGNVDILIGTQMLAKGHHFPDITLVGIIDADSSLFSVDYRASERMAQIFMQVSGRAGRSDLPGSIIVQTRYPNHPLLNELAKQNYRQFTELLLEERQQTQLPPFSFHALLCAESSQKKIAMQFLSTAKIKLQAIAKKELDVHGPISAPMEKRAGYYRLQLLIQAKNRQNIKKKLAPWVASLAKLPEAQKTRWSVDIDPQYMI